MIRLNLSYTNNSFVCIDIQTFQLTHIFSHLMNEGIGLRQLVDYYYVICDFYKVYQMSSNPSVSLSKGSSTFSPSPSSSGSGDVTALRCSEPLRSKVGGPSKVYARLCGMGPPGDGAGGVEGVGIVEVCRCHYVYHAGGVRHACLSPYCSSE